MAIEIIAIITPAPGKFDRAMEVLSTCAEGVKNNEPTAMKYKPYKSKNAEGQDVIVMLEAYGGPADIETHRATDHYKTAISTAQSEGLLAKPLEVMRLEDTTGTGFLSR